MYVYTWSKVWLCTTHLAVLSDREAAIDQGVMTDHRGFMANAQKHEFNKSAGKLMAGSEHHFRNAAANRVEAGRNSSMRTRIEESSDVMATQLASLRLDFSLQSVADELPPGTAREFLKALHLCAPCKNFERFGEPRDGGYVMCTDNLDSGETKAAYSYGVNGFDGWGMDIAKKYKIPLHEYDCTNNQVPEPCDGCDAHFHSECLMDANGTAPDASYKTLATQLQESGFGDAPDRSLIGKIDIEAAEWKVFAEEPVSTLKKFKQIVTELHWLNQESKYPLYLKALQNLQMAGFVPTHLHGNNFGRGLVEKGGYTIPNVVEVTFVPKPAEGCSRDLRTRVAQDMPNDPSESDYGEFNLPE
jgi:hypothetical protein